MERKLDAILATKATAEGYDAEFDSLWESILHPEPPPGPPSHLKRLATTTRTPPPPATTNRAGTGPPGSPGRPPTTTGSRPEPPTAATPPATRRAPQAPTTPRRKPPATRPKVIANIAAPVELRKAVARRLQGTPAAPPTPTAAATQGMPSLEPEPTSGAATTAKATVPAPMAPPVRKKVPRVGTTVQRSSAICNKKLEALMGLAAPPPRRPTVQTRPRIRPPAVAAVQAAVSRRKQNQLDELFGDLSDLEPTPTQPTEREATPTDADQLPQTEPPRSGPSSEPPVAPAPKPAPAPLSWADEVELEEAEMIDLTTPPRPPTPPTPPMPRTAPTTPRPPTQPSPPPLPTPPRTAPQAPRPTTAVETPAEDADPNEPPPVKVFVEGIPVLVPFYAAHIARKYHPRIGDRRFLVRFDRRGRCRSCHEIK